MAKELAREKLKLAESLLQHLDDIMEKKVFGIQKLKKKIEAEINFLTKGLTKCDLKSEHVLCSNLGQLSEIVNAATSVTGVTCVLKKFALSDGEKLTVDVVAHQNSSWYKIILRNPKALHETFMLGSRKGTKPLNEIADLYIEAARLHPVLFKAPQIIFVFVNGISESVANCLKEKSVHIQGRVLLDSELNLPNIPTYDSDDSSYSESEFLESSQESRELLENVGMDLDENQSLNTDLDKNPLLNTMDENPLLIDIDLDDNLLLHKINLNKDPLNGTDLEENPLLNKINSDENPLLNKIIPAKNPLLNGTDLQENPLLNKTNSDKNPLLNKTNLDKNPLLNETDDLLLNKTNPAKNPLLNRTDLEENPLLNKTNLDENPLNRIDFEDNPLLNKTNLDENPLNGTDLEENLFLNKNNLDENPLNRMDLEANPLLNKTNLYENSLLNRLPEKLLQTSQSTFKPKISLSNSTHNMSASLHQNEVINGGTTDSNVSSDHSQSSIVPICDSFQQYCDISYSNRFISNCDTCMGSTESNDRKYELNDRKNELNDMKNKSNDSKYEGSESHTTINDSNSPNVDTLQPCSLLNVDTLQCYNSTNVDTLQSCNSLNVNKLQSRRVNLDVSCMIAYTSATTNGENNFIFKGDFLTDQATWERNNPVKKVIDKYFEGSELITCKDAAKHFIKVLETVGGEKEIERGKALLEKCTVVESVDFYGAVLPLSGRVKELSRLIFGTGQALRAPTVTSNLGFIRAAENKGLNLAVLYHEPRALTEKKQPFAVKIDDH